MKSLALVSLLVLTAACHNHGHRRTKYLTLENGFDNSDNEARFNENEAKLADLESRVAALEAQATVTISQLTLNSTAISSLESGLSAEVLARQADISAINAEILTLKAQIDSVEASGEAAVDALQQDLSNLEQDLADTKTALNIAIAQGGQAYNSIISSINSLNNSSSSLQTSVNTLLTQMAQLQLQETVVGLVDPCPLVTSSGYREHFLKMKSGKLVAYFESGSTRFLTVLIPGSYQTTDSRACQFSVDAQNNIVVATAPSVPVGSTHKLLICGQVAYKVGSAISLNGTSYTSSFSSNGCNVVINNSANNVNSNGGSVSGATVCNYNNISSITGTQTGSGANSSACYATKL